MLKALPDQELLSTSASPTTCPEGREPARWVLRRRFRRTITLPHPSRPRNTVAVFAHRVSRFSHLKIHYPEWVVSGDQPPAYNAALAEELLTNTGEIPKNLSAMEDILAEYRHALRALIKEARATESA